MSKIEVKEIGPISGETDLKLGQSGGTVTLADGATAVGFGGGKVMQFQTKHGYDGMIKVDGVSAYVSCGNTWKISLTPKEASSRVIISIGSNYVNYGAGTQYMGRLKVYRQINGGGYVDIEGKDASWALSTPGYISTTNALSPFNMFYVDSTHNTTLPVDYQIYMSASNNVEVQFADSAGSYRYINAMEVAS